MELTSTHHHPGSLCTPRARPGLTHWVRLHTVTTFKRGGIICFNQKHLHTQACMATTLMRKCLKATLRDQHVDQSLWLSGPKLFHGAANTSAVSFFASTPKPWRAKGCVGQHSSSSAARLQFFLLHCLPSTVLVPPRAWISPGWLMNWSLWGWTPALEITGTQDYACVHMCERLTLLWGPTNKSQYQRLIVFLHCVGLSCFRKPHRLIKDKGSS